MVARHNFTTMIWLAIILAACGDDPMPPVACGTIPQQAVTTGQRTLVEPCFEDPEMGVLILTVVSSNPEVVTAEVLGDKVGIAGVSPGTATITVTATDPDMLEGTLKFEVLVPNRAPRLLAPMPSIRFDPGDPAVTLTLSQYFVDPDGQALTYGTTSSDTTVASVVLTVDTLTVTSRSSGMTIVTVTATDPGDLSVTTLMEVTVKPNRPPQLVKEIPPIRIPLGVQESTVRLSLSEHFEDPDGEDLSYYVRSSDTTIASTTLSADQLTVIGLSLGTATVTITAPAI